MDLRNELDEDALWSRRERHRAERIQPILGILLLAVTIVWMAKHRPEGIGGIPIVFAFVWGLYLLVRYPTIRLLEIVRTSWRHRRRTPREEVIRFHEYGYSRQIIDVMTIQFRWDQLNDVVIGDRGIGIRCVNEKRIDIQYLYVARRSFKSAHEYEKLRSFLQAAMQSGASINGSD